MSPKYEWKPGQMVAVNRRRIATVERVTPTGRAIVNGTTYRPDGLELADSTYRTVIVPLTPEVEAEIAHAMRSQDAFGGLARAIDAASEWNRWNRPKWGNDTADPAAVELAEKLTAAICALIPGGGA
jgi:hypothetical protein